MKMKNRLHVAIVLSVLLAFAGVASASDKTPGFNIKIPEKIMTPDKVETRIGTMEFFDGMPTAETVEKVYDNLDFLRGVEVFLNGIPAASIEAMRIGLVEAGATASNKVVIMDKLLDSTPLFLTGNTDTVYTTTIIDLGKDGPTIVEIPAKSGPGTVDDAYFRFIVDMGAPGPDKGQGGKYLLLPPDYEGELNPPVGGMEAEVEVTGKKEKVFVAKSKTYINWIVLRGFLVDGKPDAAAKMFKEGLKIYPLDKAANPPEMPSASSQAYSLTPPLSGPTET